MSEQSVSQAAKPSNLDGSGADRSVLLVARADPSDSRMIGSVCSFELVRGTGDGEISRLAELQHGHVHRHQIRAAGLGRNAVAHRIRTGRLHAVLPGVFLVGRPHSDLLGRTMAATLYLKGDGLAAGHAAANLWNLLDTTQTLSNKDPIDVVVVGRSARAERGVRIHRSVSVVKQDVRWRHGIPVTSPARTLLDLAGMMGAMELEAALSAAFRQNFVRRSQLVEVMGRNAHAKGIGTLRRLLEEGGGSLPDTRSKYERRFRGLLAAAELPMPTGNVWVAGKFVDGLWPELKLVLEIDGFKDHGKRHKFESDRERDQVLLSSGHQPLRVTARQIDHRPYALIARTASVITARRLALAA